MCVVNAREKGCICMHRSLSLSLSLSLSRVLVLSLCSPFHPTVLSMSVSQVSLLGCELSLYLSRCVSLIASLSLRLFFLFIHR
jgi:hypothetical protein